jgi:hypothetical protein
MSNRLLERFGAACGILYVVLIIVGGSIGGPTSTVALFLIFLAFPLFLFFLGSLWAALHRAEGGSGWLSTTAFGGGSVAIAVKLVGDAPLLAVRKAGEGLDPQLAQALLDTYDVSFALHFFPLAVLLAASAIVAIRSGGIPRWLGWAAAVISGTLIVGAAAETAKIDSQWADFPFVLFMLWTLVTSIVLMWRPGVSHSAESNSVVIPPSVAS